MHGSQFDMITQIKTSRRKYLRVNGKLLSGMGKSVISAHSDMGDVHSMMMPVSWDHCSTGTLQMHYNQ